MPPCPPTGLPGDPLRRPLVAVLTAAGVAAAGLATAAPALAITNGTADGSGHPNVGALVAATAYADGTWTYCSGTLIWPTVFLTAAHTRADCDEG